MSKNRPTTHNEYYLLYPNHETVQNSRCEWEMVRLKFGPKMCNRNRDVAAAAAVDCWSKRLTLSPTATKHTPHHTADHTRHRIDAVVVVVVVVLVVSVA